MTPGTGSCSRKHSYSTVLSQALYRKPNLRCPSFFARPFCSQSEQVGVNASGHRRLVVSRTYAMENIFPRRPPSQAHHLSNGWIVPSSPSSSVHIASSLHDRIRFSNGPFGGWPHFPSYLERVHIPWEVSDTVLYYFDQLFIPCYALQIVNLTRCPQTKYIGN